MQNKPERRQFKRFLFSGESKVTAKLSLFDTDDTSVLSHITNLSEEGLGLNFGVNLTPPFCEGDLIILTEIEGLPGLKFLVGVEMKLKWIVSYKSSKMTLSGCIFTNISPVVKEKIRQFIQKQIDQKLNNTEVMK